jgi:signal transduction histidine kinase
MPATLRGRIMLAYAVGVAVVVTAGLALGYVVLTAQLRNAAAQDLGNRLDDLTAAVQAGGQAALLRDPYAQLITTNSVADRVDAHSPAAPTVPVLTHQELTAATHKRLTIHREVPGLNENTLLTAQSARRGQVVVVGTSLTAVELAADRILLGLTVLGPLLVIVLTLAVRRLVDTALAPVAALTAEASDISAAETDRRLPEPPGHDEIAELSRTLNAMLGRLAAAQDRERAFVDDAAHELRTPVAVLRAELELGLAAAEGAAPGGSGPDGDGSADPDSETEILRTALHRARAEADRLGRLAEDLLVMARAKAGNLELNRLPTDVTAALRPWTSRLAAVTGAQVTISGPELVAVVDPARLEQVVTNLVGNAVEAGASRVQVRLAVHLPDGMLLEISDDGPGFPEHLLPVAFSRFSRGTPARTRDAANGGAGLGLAIVAAVVRAHRGTVQAGNGSRLGGAWVRIVLPGPTP